MSASQLKALNNSASQEVALTTGFGVASLVLVILVLVGLCLSFTLRFENKNLSL
ncbi:hypothetical protein [Clostridium kluyveri]|uniref:hypothetical protein n=1 Tax=Clostridium kluyveri TaxID=1534 RepID=UPI000B290F38|nr:hypothetical protein [Clostridium kluyveri]